MNKVILHREILKHNLFNYDWSNTPINKMILVELDYNPDGFTHWKSSCYNTEQLIEKMNCEVKEHPDYDLIIIDKSSKTY